MATFADMKLTHRLFSERYPFVRYAVKDNPTAKLKKPLSESKVALITSAGLMLPKDKRFSSTFKRGDHTFREIPNDVPVDELIEDHDSSSFDHSGIEKDRNLAFPLDRFRELVEAGTVGELNKRHFSFMGSILAPNRLIKESAPEVAKKIVGDGVDAVFLTPV